jgi:hypothetical protein
MEARGHNAPGRSVARPPFHFHYFDTCSAMPACGSVRLFFAASLTIERYAKPSEHLRAKTPAVTHLQDSKSSHRQQTPSRRHARPQKEPQ